MDYCFARGLIIKRDGDSQGILNEETVHHLIEKYKKCYDPIDQASCLLYGITMMHPFFDGNKRKMFLLARIALSHQCMSIDASNEEVIDFMLSVARGEKTELQVNRWIHKNLSTERF